MSSSAGRRKAAESRGLSSPTLLREQRHRERLSLRPRARAASSGPALARRLLHGGRADHRLQRARQEMRQVETVEELERGFARGVVAARQECRPVRNAEAPKLVDEHP